VRDAIGRPLKFQNAPWPQYLGPFGVRKLRKGEKTLFCDKYVDCVSACLSERPDLAQNARELCQIVAALKKPRGTVDGSRTDVYVADVGQRRSAP